MRDFYDRYERWLIPGALVLGVVVDFVTFTSIQIETAFLILGGHVLIAGGAIVFLQAEIPRLNEKRSLGMTMKVIAPLALQFSFGALLSASFVFYWFSGALSVSWPILCILAVLMASNDVLRHWFERPVVQFTVFAFILFSIATLVFPYVLNSVEESVFVLAGVSSLVLLALFAWPLLRFLPHLRALRPQITIGVIGMFVFMNGLYFFNIIPPIPLSLREAGVYHQVARSGAAYVLTAEARSLFDRLLPGQTVHLQPGQRVYLYTALFAPAKLHTTIVHRWQFFDPARDEWVDRDQLSFPLTGGRDEGYRGYTQKSALQEGKWRVSVETKRGQTLARVGFRVEHIKESPEFVTLLR